MNFIAFYALSHYHFDSTKVTKKIVIQMQPKRLTKESKKKLLNDCIKSTPVSKIASDHCVSRGTVYTHINKASKVINESLDQPDEVLFNIPVTKRWLSTVIVLLFIVCKVSIRDVVSFIKYAFDIDVSSGKVSSVLDDATSKAAQINDSYDLSSCNNSATDEIFHRSDPVLAAIDLDSQFCMELKYEDSRDHNTWGYHLLNMMDRGYNPTNNIMDGGSGMKKAFSEVLSDVNIRYDHFHIIQTIKDTSRFLKNRYESAVTECVKLSTKLDKTKDHKIRYKLQKATKSMENQEYVYKQFSTLTTWLQYDILQLQSICYDDRIELFGFILQELQTLSNRHPHRIQNITTTLINNKDKLLDVVHELNIAFNHVAKEYSVGITDIWAICNNARYNLDSDQYNINYINFHDKHGDIFDSIEDDVLQTISQVHRSSSLIENLNSRIRIYLDARKGFKKDRFELIKFALNHLPRRRSANQKLKNKSAAEVFSKKDSIDFISLLELQQFRQTA
jgi:hypothetical protein